MTSKPLVSLTLFGIFWSVACGGLSNSTSPSGGSGGISTSSGSTPASGGDLNVGATGGTTGGTTAEGGYGGEVICATQECCLAIETPEELKALSGTPCSEEGKGCAIGKEVACSCQPQSDATLAWKCGRAP